MGDPAGAARLYTAHLAHSDFETLEPEEGCQEGCQEGSHDVTMMSPKSCLSTGLSPDFLHPVVCPQQPMRAMSGADAIEEEL